MRSAIDGLIRLYGPAGAGIVVGLLVVCAVCAVPFFLAMVLSRWG